MLCARRCRRASAMVASDRRKRARLMPQHGTHRAAGASAPRKGAQGRQRKHAHHALLRCTLAPQWQRYGRGSASIVHRDGALASCRGGGMHGGAIEGTHGAQRPFEGGEISARARIVALRSHRCARAAAAPRPLSGSARCASSGRRVCSWTRQLATDTARRGAFCVISAARVMPWQPGACFRVSGFGCT